MQERTLLEEIKHQYKHGGMHIRLIFINTIVFLIIGLTTAVVNLSKTAAGLDIMLFLENVFTLKTDLGEFITHPWGLITNMFAHFKFGHYIFNMIFLFFSGMMFLQFFTSRRMLHVYIWGGIAGGLFELLAHLAFVNLESRPVVGASASITALFIAIAVYRPSLRVNVFGLIPVPLIVIAGIFVLSDLVGLGQADSVAHFAHIGGALVGLLSVQNLHSSTNIINMSESFWQRIASGFSRLIRPQQKLRVEKGGARGGVKTDEQYNMDAKARQQKVDAILDKISKSGYESLTKAEKEFLFSQSKK